MLEKMMLGKKISLNPLEKTFFFMINLSIIPFLKESKIAISFFIWFLFLFLIQKGDFKRKILIYISALLFLIPPLLIQGMSIENKKVNFNIDYEILTRVLLTVTVSGTYLLGMKFKDFCSVLFWIKIPKYIVEIIIYMYKFVTLMYKNYLEHILSLKNRNGVLKIKEISLITTKIFNKLYMSLEEMEIASYSRGYTNEFKYIEKKQSISLNILILYLIYVSIVIYILKF